MENKIIKPETPIVSVIMITYNQQQFIEDAVRSVLKQKTQYNYELIIADDASTDKTGEIVEELMLANPNKIKYLRREQNMGLQNNFLDAYKKARGKYVAICEGDDFWCSRHKIERQVNFMETHPDYTVCFHRVINFYIDDNSKSLSNPKQKKSITLEDLSKSNVITNLSVMYRKLNNEKLPDWLTCIKLFDYGMHSIHSSYGKIGFIKYPMAVYRRHSGGIWSGNLNNSLKLAMDVREKLVGHFYDIRKEAALNYFMTFKDNAVRLAKLQLENGQTNDYEETIERLKKLNSQYFNTLNVEEIENDIRNGKGENIKSSNLKSGIKIILSKIRVNVSKIIPLPRI